MGEHGLSSIDEADKHLYTDNVRSDRLAKLAEQSIVGLFRDLGGAGKCKSDSRIGHLSSLIEAVSGYFNVEVRILIEDRKPHIDAKNNRAVLGGEWRRVQRSEGYSAMLVNGEVTFQDGKCSGATPGRLLRSGG